MNVHLYNEDRNLYATSILEYILSSFLATQEGRNITTDIPEQFQEQLMAL